MSISTQSDLVSALLAADPDSAEVRRANLGVIQTQVIPDANNLNYSGGSITFNSQSLIGATSKRLIDFANAIVCIPVTTVVRTSTAGASFGSITSNVPSLAPGDVPVIAINPLLAISQMEMRVGNQLVHAAQEGLPMQLANRARALSPEQRRYVLDVLGWDIDDFVSQVYSSTTGMMNNIPAPPGTLVTGDNLRLGNSGLWNRVRRQNVRSVGVTDATMQPANTYSATEREGLIGCYDDQGNAVPLDGTTRRYTGGTNRFIQTLVFQTMLRLPMWLLSDVWQHCPPLATVTGFSLRLQTAFTQSNSWTAVFGTSAAGAYTPVTSVSAVQLDGLCCPYTLVALSQDGAAVGSARMAASNVTIIVQGTVGYRSTLPTVVNGRVTSAPERPARIHCSAILPTPSAWQQWDAQRTALLRYSDFLIDTSPGVGPNASVTKALQHSPSFLRRLTILPVLAAGANRCNGLQSLLDSAPMTCPPVLLDSVQIRVAGQQLHLDPLRLTLDKYLRTAMVSQQAFGSAYADLSSMTGSFSGQTYLDWQASPILQWDLSGVIDEADDAESKNIQISFTNLSGETIDVYYVIEFESRVTLDLLNSTAVR